MIDPGGLLVPFVLGLLVGGFLNRYLFWRHRALEAERHLWETEQGEDA